MVLDLACLYALLLEVGEVFGDLAEGAIEDWHFVLYAEAHVRVLVVGTVARCVDVGGFEGNRLVAVGLGNLDPAVPVAVFHVRAAEDDEARLEFLCID